ncbi:MAG: hypothetical protein U9Q93_00140 [Pseudomonadota bacterium]|jgi:hypothetical protein|nr:hypothetical protein [Pseudomonadota bacterium]|tara:strand:- start:23288 stop:23485 length:198 start_codon:yes stop_codon:yes gene_type:complete
MVITYPESIAHVGAASERLLEIGITLIVEKTAQALGKYRGLDKDHGGNVRQWRTKCNADKHQKHC